MEKETLKQLKYIKLIEAETGIIYKGSSKKEAQEYIKQNKDKLSNFTNINTWSIINGY